MGRFLELIVCGIFLWLFLESWVARITGRGGRGGRGGRAGRVPGPPPASQPRPPADVTLVRCAGCGTHVPLSRAIAPAGALPAAGSGSVYCSERCLRGGERAGSGAPGRGPL